MDSKFAQLIFAFVLLIGGQQVFAQAPGNIAKRTDVDLNLWPFLHGVASGDPLSDRVIIWTRITPGEQAGPISVDWEMATDTGFTNVVQSGTETTDSSADFTIKIDVTGLPADSWYYYRFEHNDRKSLTGRTRTAPDGDADSLRFAVVSCSDYVDGYFHGYRKIAERNDVDAVIHLGDYIYENGSAGSLGRPHDPPERINELNDYRQRYSQYRLDPDLRCIHQMYPFINVWDDHESANNSWKGGAEAHDFPGDGVWEHRKRMAVQAFFEWIPIRHPDPQDTIRIYRTLKWGDLVDLVMLDSRLIERDSQVTGAAMTDPDRQMIGAEQLSWLSQEMQNSSAQWKVVGQQVMMAPLEAPGIGAVNGDAWDGYAAERQRFYDTVLTKNIDNIVVLTGDIHTAWANNLLSGSDPVGVEFVVSSVTTQNSPLPIPQELIQLFNSHIEYINLDDHGYYILDVNKTRVQANYYFVGDITNPTDNSETAAAFWYVDDGTATLQEATDPSPPRASVSVIQPPKDAPNAVGIKDDVQQTAMIIGTYPNPFWRDLVVKTYFQEPTEVVLELYDQKGSKVFESEQQEMNAGLHYIPLEGKDLSKGLYLIKLRTSKAVFSRRVVKI